MWGYVEGVDRSVNLFNVAEAIFSICFYLRLPNLTTPFLDELVSFIDKYLVIETFHAFAADFEVVTLERMFLSVCMNRFRELRQPACKLSGMSTP